MMNELVESLIGPSGHLLTEALSAKDIALMKLQFAYPDMRPCTFDETIEAWVERISMWGKLKFSYKDPESNRWSTVTKTQFLKVMTDSSSLKLFGRWDIELVHTKKVRQKRTFINSDGKSVTEEFTIECD